MSLASKLLSASGGTDRPAPEDVFSAYTYTGNGSTQTITNGIDLAGKGGLVWLKRRNDVSNNTIRDSVRNAAGIYTNSAQMQSGANGIPTFTSTGFTLDNTAGNDVNATASTYVSWTFLKSAKFFDVVTYTGTGVNKVISHALGQEVGMIYVKRTDTASDWQVYHRGTANTEYMVLNSTAAKTTGTTRWNSTTPTDSVFSVGTDTTVNASGGTYVAYLFAHDSNADGIIQCGSFTTDGSGNATVNLGWEPQFVLTKSAASGSWFHTDLTRGFTADGTIGYLMPNLTNAESSVTSALAPSATGFSVKSSLVGASTTCIYLAIRRPNKFPTVGTQVYNAIARTGTGVATAVTGVGFAPDLVLVQKRTSTYARSAVTFDRLRGSAKLLSTCLPDNEQTYTNTLSDFNMDGVTFGVDASNYVNTTTDTHINYFFKRTRGVFDTVCDTGTGSNKSEVHNLKVPPELIIRKSRSGATQWEVYFASLGNTQKLVLNSTAAAVTDTTAWNNTTPTANNFTVGTGANVNTNAATYVTYLFATKGGISKVGSYVGNGTNQTIDMGFTTGCRYFLVKASSATGSWWCYDSVRGIVASTDFALQLNSTAAEITSADCVDPASSGIVVNQEATCSINANGVTYQYLAFA